MPKRSSLESRFPTQSIDVVVAGRTFQFGLNHRTLSLGATGDIDYYWMDSSQFRKGPKAQKLQLRNLFSCIELWWQAAQAAGEAADPSQIRHLLVANCYSLFANDKAMQNVYRWTCPRKVGARKSELCLTLRSPSHVERTSSV